MREIITLQIGQAGNNIGTCFWQSICEDHCINPTGTYTGTSDVLLDKIHVYYNETSRFRYMPRTVLFDSGPESIDTARASTIGRLFLPDHCIYKHPAAGGNWAKGNYNDTAELIDQAIDIIRRDAEACDSLQGFQIMHSLGGGTGSGPGCILISKVRENYPCKIIHPISIFPSPKVSDTVVEPYNAVLSIQQLINLSSMVQLIDNEALYNICFRTLKLSNPSMGDLNYLISSALVGSTSSLRFPGDVNSNLRKLATNLVPYPNMLFCMTSHAPMCSRGSIQRYPSFPELAQMIMDPKNFLCAADPRHGRYFSAYAVMRVSDISRGGFESIYNLPEKNKMYFANWIPDSFKVSVLDVQPRRSRNTLTMLSNSTAISEVFRRVMEMYTAMFRRKAFLHWYTAEGMEEIEFVEAESSVNDLISEYEQYQQVGDEEEGFEEDEGQGNAEIPKITSG